MKQICLAAVLFLVCAAAAPAQTGIYKVDFMNFTYTPSCAGGEGEPEERFSVKKGAFTRERKIDGFVERYYFAVLGVEYGDLDGDRQDEAVVNTLCNTGGTGQFTEGLIYTLRAGKPALLVRFLGGDRADGGIRSLKVENGSLIADVNDPGLNGGACCPEGAITSQYRLTGNKLVEAGVGVKRELYPKQRLAFDRGTSSKTFIVKIAAGDRKRYTVGARGGQTLDVSINTGDASVALLGDTGSTSGTNSLTARLPKPGDYSFEVANDGEKDIEVTVTVNIR